jgi:hypothetical protein
MKRIKQRQRRIFGLGIPCVGIGGGKTIRTKRTGGGFNQEEPKMRLKCCDPVACKEGGPFYRGALVSNFFVLCTGFCGKSSEQPAVTDVISRSFITQNCYPFLLCSVVC